MAWRPLFPAHSRIFLARRQFSLDRWLLFRLGCDFTRFVVDFCFTFPSSTAFLCSELFKTYEHSTKRIFQFVFKFVFGWTFNIYTYTVYLCVTPFHLIPYMPPDFFVNNKEKTLTKTLLSTRQWNHPSNPQIHTKRERAPRFKI